MFCRKSWNRFNLSSSMGNDLLDLVNVARSSRREHSALLMQGTGLALLFFLFYGPTIAGLVKDWRENSTFSYGFLIPLIAAYLVWERRGEIRSTPICATVRGIFPFALAVILGLIGNAVGDTFTARVSMILALG